MKSFGEFFEEFLAEDVRNSSGYFSHLKVKKEKLPVMGSEKRTHLHKISKQTQTKTDSGKLGSMYPNVKRKSGLEHKIAIHKDHSKSILKSIEKHYRKESKY